MAHSESREPGAAVPRGGRWRSEWRATDEHRAQGGAQTLQHLRVVGACSHAGLGKRIEGPEALAFYSITLQGKTRDTSATHLHHNGFLWD